MKASVRKLKQAVDDYLLWMISSNYADSTVKNYEQILNHFVQFVRSHKVDWDNVFSSENITIEGNSVINNSGETPVGYGGIQVHNSMNIIINNNSLFNNKGGIYFTNFWEFEGENYNFIIENNNISGNEDGIAGCGDFVFINNGRLFLPLIIFDKRNEPLYSIFAIRFCSG